VRKLILGFICAFAVTTAAPQSSHLSSGEILLKLHKLNVLGNALYVAAHPDDENTRMIAYLGNERLVNTAYLSLTRGDGGQNLIGPELREGLGVIRTQELLAARRLDGGKQFFTRANDFGYSKTATETLNIWDRQAVLSDVVWVFRKFRPDIVITRFPPDARAGHGHHTSSAIMAEEAFAVAGSKEEFPEQFSLVQPWQPARMMINSGRWWDTDIENRPGVLKIDVGAYNPFLGLSYSEIAADSRSQHKSQGFGNSRSRGESMEYLTIIAGDTATRDIFEGIDLTWARIGASHLEEQVNNIIAAFDAAHPEEIIADLLNLRTRVASIKDTFWRSIKLKEIDHLIMDCSGLFIGAWAGDYSVVPGETLAVNLEIVNRSEAELKLVSVSYLEQDTIVDTPLFNNQKLILPLTMTPDGETDYSVPYWLAEPSTLGMYTVSDQKKIGLPENKAALSVVAEFMISSHRISYTVPVVYRWTDRVNGEMTRPVSFIPPVFVNPANQVQIFNNRQPKTIKVNISSGKADVSGEAYLRLPSGWKSEPAAISVELRNKFEEKQISFMVTPPAGEQAITITAAFKANQKEYDQSLQTIAYDHIPYQVLLPKAEIKAVRADISSYAKTVGYIMGAGDQVPAAMEQLGIKVWIMNENDITDDNLQQLDAVILGIRALNTNTWLKAKKDVLLDYVERGGTLVTQYNTTRRLDWMDFAPYELKFTGRSSDSRVSEETAKIGILEKGHMVLNKPNPIIPADFDNWVQERGLYFPSAWDDHYTAVLSSNDTNESPKNGGLLIAGYGQGYYVYTGYSWFRELPAGVPGAYKLFANIISLSKSMREQKSTSGQK
jgi:LmbE family N-acetylglucosaminyl deacetylase